MNDAEDLKALERRLRAMVTAADVEAAARRASARIPDAAAEAGLLDVAYSITDSPLGRILIALSHRGVVRIEYAEHINEALDALAAHVSPRMLESPKATGEARRELDEYFEGRRQHFELPVDLSAIHGFSLKVLRATELIPFGSVSTYRTVAGKAGNSMAMRAAGNALGSNPIPIVVPCHRVIRTDGGLGGYGGQLNRKIALLRLEGTLED